MNAARILIVSAAGLCTNAALAQWTSHSSMPLPPPNGGQAGGVRAAFPSPNMSNFGGARMGFSQQQMGFPQPSHTLGGVKAVLPTTPRGTIGNPAPAWDTAYRPMNVGPIPSYPVNPGWGGGGNHPPVPTPYGQGGSAQGGGMGGFPGGGGAGGQGNNWHGGNGNNWNGASSGWNGSGSINSSGVTINGHYSDDNFKLAFHVGSPFSHHHDWCNNNTFNGYPTYYYPPIYYGYPAWGSWSYYSDTYNPAAYSNYAGYTPNMNPAPAPAPSYHATPQPVTPSNDRELGDTYLRAGDAHQAIRAYRKHLADNPHDATAMRALGLALIEASEFRDGTAMMSLAYTSEPALAGAPVPLDVYAGGAEELRDNILRVSLYANRVKTPSAWLSLAALMQAEGRTAVAKTAIEKAAAAGLNKTVADRFRNAL